MALSLNLERKPTHWQLSVAGELDFGQCSQFRMSLDRILMSEPRSTIIDLSGLEYLDSSGLGLLLAMSKEHATVGGQLVLITNRTVDNILSLTRLHGVFATTSTMEEAVQVLGHDSPTLGAAQPQ